MKKKRKKKKRKKCGQKHYFGSLRLFYGSAKYLYNIKP